MTDAGDDPEPLRLDVRGPAAASMPVGGDVTRPRKWALLIAAFVLGAAVSLIVADARRSIEERTTLDVVLGAQELTVTSPTTVEYAVRNVGPRPVDILHIVPVGWKLTADQVRAVTVAPDEWVRVTTAVKADCDVRPDTTAQVTARSGSGERSIGTTLSPGANNDLLAAWAQACPVRPLVEIAGGFAEPRSPPTRS